MDFLFYLLALIEKKEEECKFWKQSLQRMTEDRNKIMDRVNKLEEFICNS